MSRTILDTLSSNKIIWVPDRDRVPCRFLPFRPCDVHCSPGTMNGRRKAGSRLLEAKRLPPPTCRNPGEQRLEQRRDFSGCERGNRKGEGKVGNYTYSGNRRSGEQPADPSKGGGGGTPCVSERITWSQFIRITWNQLKLVKHFE